MTLLASIFSRLFKSGEPAPVSGPTGGRGGAAAAINHVDVAFVVDTTGSMGTFINAARERLLKVVDALSERGGLDVHLGLVEFRDHPPQDSSFVTREHELTADRKKIQEAVASLQPNGGGDGPEAVFDGVHAACDKLAWRPGSARIVLLVGDAPPHGVGAPGDGFARGCPCGLDTDAVTARAEQARVTVHAVCMSGDQHARRAFGRIASGAGGVVVDAAQGGRVIEVLGERLEADFAELALDRRVLDEVLRQKALDASAVAQALDTGRYKVAAALSRLGRRGLLDEIASDTGEGDTGDGGARDGGARDAIAGSGGASEGGTSERGAGTAEGSSRDGSAGTSEGGVGNGRRS